MKKLIAFIALAAAAAVPARADVPGEINFQGRISLPRAEAKANERGENQGEKERSKLFPFTGAGLFKFAIVDGAGNVLWTNVPGNLTAPPPADVSIPVQGGIFNVALGDPALGMPAISSAVFSGTGRLLRVFFKTPEQTNFAELLPPQKLLTVPYAFAAATAQSLPQGATVQVNAIAVSSATIDVLSVSSAAINSLFVPTQIEVGGSTFLTFTKCPVATPCPNKIAFTGGPGLIFNSGSAASPFSLINGGILDLEAAGGLFLNTVSTGAVIMSTQPASLVGIGTAAPTQKLEVNGDILSDYGLIASTGAFSGAVTAAAVSAPAIFGGTMTAALFQGGRFVGDGSGLTGITAAGVVGAATSLASAGNVVIHSDTNTVGVGDVVFLTGASEKMRLTDAGNLGIGTTRPSYKLDLNSPAFTSSFVTTFNDSDGINTTFHVDQNNSESRLMSNNAIALASNNSGSDSLFINTAGNVGIGTNMPSTLLAGVSAPTAKLTTAGDAAVLGQFVTTGNRAYFLGGDGSGFYWIMSGGTVEGINNALGFIPSSKSIISGPGWTKNFLIYDPLDPKNKYLVHATLEGPEAAVFYRGQGQLSGGRAVVTLPPYFEALVRKEGRTVLLTPVFDAEEPISELGSSPVANGQFIVRAADKANPSQKFFWEVKGVRADVPPLQVELPR